MTADRQPDLTAHRDEVWDLEQFVAITNALLPTYLPKEAVGRASDEVNARLIRHYATQGLISEARKEGREARYLFHHLVEVLTVRKLLAEGFTTTATKQVTEGRSTDDLRRLLEGSVRIELVPESAHTDAGDRLEFLKRVRQRAGLARAQLADAERAATKSLANTLDADPRAPLGAHGGPPAGSPFTESHWTRLSILDGLDLFVRDDFALPKNRLGDAQLTQLLQFVLLQLEQRRKATG